MMGVRVVLDVDDVDDVSREHNLGELTRATM